MPKPVFDAGLIDADSLLWKAGALSQRKEWYVYRNDNEIDHYESKTLLNKWLKQEHEINSKAFTKIVMDNQDEVHTLEHGDDEWRLEGVQVLQPVSHAIQVIKAQVESIMIKALANDYWVYLSGGKNYRYDIYKDYKESRANIPKPIHYQDMREYMVNKWPCVESTTIEADDAVCIDENEMHHAGMKAVIIHIDKDIDQNPRYHYNWDWELIVGRDAHYHVTRDEARRSFFMQLLVGDKADDIPGIHRVGNSTATKMLGGATKMVDYERIVKDAYQQYWLNDEEHAITKQKTDDPMEAYERNAKLLFMLREPFTSIEDIDWRSHV